MRAVLLAFLFVVAVDVAAFTEIAPFVPCKVGKTVQVGHADGIRFQWVSFVEPYGEVGASVFVPDSQSPIPGMVFSHSAIHGPTNTADLTRMALALARAGAASIVLDGSIEWVRPNDDSRRPAHVMACAGQWLLLNANLDVHRLGTAGTLGWGGGDTPHCLQGERPCWHPSLAITFGQTSNVEFWNTNALLTINGQLHSARFVQQVFHLVEVKPEWFVPKPAKQQVNDSAVPSIPSMH